MVKKYSIFLYVISFYCFGFSQEPADNQMLFEQANDSYKKGDYSQAYKQYQQITDKNTRIHYNLGNCAFKLNKPGLALAHWRRAEKDWGLYGREELVKNIALVQQHSAILHTNPSEQEQTLLHALVNWAQSTKSSFYSLVQAIPLLYIQLLVLLLWIILFATIRFLYKKGHKIIVSVLFFFLAISAIMLAFKYNFMHKERIVVIVPSADLTSGPGKNYAVLSHLPEAQEADILKESGGFFKIRAKRQLGWIEKNAVEKI
jgi:tetratricopeptide (TPR) repeat protein